MREKLIDALTEPGFFSEPVELVETHISWILLTGETAYKIKKPLNLGFLDFSTLERRRHFCTEEVRLNRRTAPELYLDVAAIRGTPEAPRFDGDDEAIEYAVRMKRFDSDLGFDRLLDRNELERKHVVDLARRLADLHLRAEVAPPDAGFGTFEEVAEPMRENFDALADAAGGAYAERTEPLRAWTERRLDALATSIRARLRDGFVREGHGDAHLGNVTLYRGRATLFDCIEFSESLRWIDVANDLAFTVMDLRDRGAPTFAWTLLDEYLARTGDFGALPLLPIYAVYRALVRAKVQGLARDQADEQERRQRLDREIEGYLALASRIADEQRTGLFITVGLSGSGKSWIAERLAADPGLVRIRSDVERKRLHGLAPDQASGSALDADLYSDAASERTYARLAEAAEAGCRAGMPVLIDAAFLDRARRRSFRALADRLGVPFAIIHCSAPQEVLAERVRERKRRGDDASEAGLDVLEHQLGRADPLDPGERRVAIEVDTRAPDAVETVAAALAQRIADGPPRAGAD